LKISLARYSSSAQSLTPRGIGKTALDEFDEEKIILQFGLWTTSVLSRAEMETMGSLCKDIQFEDDDKDEEKEDNVCI
jgi:hypothetical protein